MSDSLQAVDCHLKRHEGTELSPTAAPRVPNPGYWPQPRDKVSRKMKPSTATQRHRRSCCGSDDRTPWWNTLPDHKRIVMASMAFQLGVGGLSVPEHARSLKMKRPRGRRQMRDSLWHRQTTARAEELARRGLAHD